MSSTGQQLQNVSGAECYIDIYPYEGGMFTITGGSLLALTTSKGIKGDSGTFAVTLAPDFVNPTSYLSWSQVITPMSLAVIGMRRGGLQSVVMVGVVMAVSEVEIWNTGTPVQRGFRIQGFDFGYFFTLPDYYSLWYLGSLQGSNGQGLLTQGNLLGDPGSVGQHWFDTIMVGSAGVFGSTEVMFNGSPVTLQSAMGEEFDTYDVTIPFGDYFMGVNGSWWEKFNLIFPFPFYEFFVTTNFNNNYAATGGYEFYQQTLGNSVTASPVVVARKNPVPQLVATAGANQLPTFTGVDTSLWNALPAFDLMGMGPIESTVSFDFAMVRNFYTINPTYFGGLNGGPSNNIRFPIFNYSVLADRASINRYGYRPMNMETIWFGDLQGYFAQGQGANAGQTLQQTFSQLYGRLAGYYEPTPLMANARVTTILRPDIVVGTTFTYAPFRDGVVWQFYIEGVQHEYVFGGKSKTTLMLTRGLPASVYADSSANGVLFNLYTGNAQRLNGQYVTGLPNGSAASLQALSQEAFNTWQGTIDKLYITPQGTAQSP